MTSGPLQDSCPDSYDYSGITKVIEKTGITTVSAPQWDLRETSDSENLCKYLSRHYLLI